jgi:hypothetical protein
MEIFNSGALRSDNMELSATGWRSSTTDTGHRRRRQRLPRREPLHRRQGRTYISCKDADPGKIDVAEACDNLLKGRALVSLGLLTQIKVNGRYGPGDLVTGATATSTSRSGSWAPPGRASSASSSTRTGPRIRDEWIERGAAGGEKARLRWKIGRPKNDVHLVAVASGPGVRELYWPLAQPLTSRTRRPGTPRSSG